MNDIKFSDEVRDKISRGAKTLERAVSTTLGPGGRNVVIDNGFGRHITKDGVTVAKSIILQDKYENIGAQLIKEVSSKTCDVAGDGTTTATVLAHAIYSEGLKALNAGHNPVELQRGIKQAADEIIKKLNGIAIPTQNKEEITAVATVSANWDHEIGELIADAIDRVGKDGTVTVENGKGFDTTLDVVEGMQLNRGFLSPHFNTDGVGNLCEIEKARVLLYDGKISHLGQIIELLESAAKTKTPLVFIAEDVEAEALSALTINKMRGTLNCVAIKNPGFGDIGKEILKDLAALTGGQVISSDYGIKIEDATLDHLGHIGKIKVTRQNTTLTKCGDPVEIENGNYQEQLENRCEQLRHIISTSDSEYEINKTKERLAKLSGGVAVISVGAATETEVNEKRDRIDDALAATRAAIRGGVVPGGGIALIRASQSLDISTDNMTSTQLQALQIVCDACMQPLKKIADNAGHSGDVIISQVFNTPDERGFDAKTGTMVHMMESGIVDPKIVTETALANASSIAGLLLTTECAITPLKEPQNKVENSGDQLTPTI